MSSRERGESAGFSVLIAACERASGDKLMPTVGALRGKKLSEMGDRWLGKALEMVIKGKRERGMLRERDRRINDEEDRRV